ncbi:MAG: hypothetical protein L0J00_01010 [Corynebacterium sp.]|nr:hypothetical protein [Corynebacterium sp.]
MTRYLLFDSSCSTCSNIANQAQEVAGDWLTVCSFDQAKHLLDDMGAADRSRPALVIKNDAHIQVKQGLQLTLTLISGIGMRRALKLIKLISREFQSPGISRRSVLQGLGATIVLGLTGSTAARAQTNPWMTQELKGKIQAHTLRDTAVQQLLDKAKSDGYSPEHKEVVVTPTDDDGYIVFIFLGHQHSPEANAALIVYETENGKTNSSMSYVSGDTNSLVNETGFHPETLSVSPSYRGADNSMQPYGVGDYVDCIVSCVGANCAVPALNCRRLLHMYVVLACMTVACGSKVNVCHKVCKGKW